MFNVVKKCFEQGCGRISLFLDFLAWVNNKDGRVEGLREETSWKAIIKINHQYPK